MSEPTIREIRIEFTRWISDDFPGVVEFCFCDRTMKQVRFVEKVPIVTTLDLNASSPFPQPGTLACVVLAERLDETSPDCVEIDTSHPYGVESVDGRTRFFITRSQLLPQ